MSDQTHRCNSYCDSNSNSDPTNHTSGRSHTHPAPARLMGHHYPARRSRDAGMTLPELLISVTMMGLLTAVIAGAIIVTLRQGQSTEGRLNLSRSEQSIGMWLPNDLASADDYTKNPGASPCGAPVCDGIDLSDGSNVLMLTWSVANGTAEGVTTQLTNVSYHFSPSEDGSHFVLRRVECVDTGGGWSCSSHTLLGEFPGPPAGIDWIPGVIHGNQCVQAGGVMQCTEPSWVIEVSIPLRADATSDGEENYATGDQVKDANRVIVTIDGGGDGGDSSGGTTKISITAGGTNRELIDASSLLGAPSFIEARSRCGGPLTLVVDTSGSINSAGASGTVTSAVRGFAETLVGTPVQLQIVEFDNEADTLGGGSAWHRYFDLLDIDGDVRELLTDYNMNGSADGGHINRLTYGGWTNWDDALFRTFYNENGTIADDYPETVVFFTDGAPTADREMGSSYKSGGDLAGQPSYPRPPYEADPVGPYVQAAFNRANYISTQNRGNVRLVGVGVGGINDELDWVTNPGTGYVNQWQRGYRRYQYSGTTTVYEKASTLSTNLDFEEYRNGSFYYDITPREYFQRNTSSHTSQSRGSDDVRIGNDNNWRRGTNNSSWWDVSFSDVVANLNLGSTIGTSGSWFRVDAWTTATKAEFDAAPQAQKNAGLWRSTSTTETRWVTEQEYLANNNPSANPPNSDGWVDAGEQAVSKDADAMYWKDVSSVPSGTNVNSSNDGYRRIQTTPATPPPGGYDGYTPKQTVKKTGGAILANLIAGDDLGIPWVTNPDNAEIANMYVLPKNGFNQLQGALKAVALGECGGTLTIRTQLESGAPVRDPFTYQNGAAWNAAGAPLTIEPSVINTNLQYPTGTFDFAIPGGTTVDVLISPQNYSELGDYTPVGWSCRAGIRELSQGSDYVVAPVLDDQNQPTGWSSIRVTISANEAVACTQTVRPS
ncbi:MAG: VWA domain-containing protein [Ilumatobacter fluminis]|uniref:vWA domain-containing protein n=1 Tax=Ilumatobacter fluminis TaxID=467091 RepID=UPI0032EC4427